MQNTIYHWISISVLAEITKQSPGKLQKLYREIIQDDCVLLIEIIYEVTGVSAPGSSDRFLIS